MKIISPLLLGGAILLFIMMIVLLYPKTLYPGDSENIQSCQCQGKSLFYGSLCMGIPRNCEQLLEEEQACEPIACEDLITKEDREKAIINGSDILVVVDSSNSMEGNKFTSAKEAAHRLISSVGENERIGIIAFNEEAIAVHSFSSDKKTLGRAIDDMGLGGGTRYLPALEMAEEFFNATEEAIKKGIIFLSDGVPSDDEQEILDTSRELLTNDINLFTISFGIEEKDTILKKMVEVQNPLQKERLYKSFSETEDISEAFTEAYQELTSLRLLNIQTTQFSRKLSHHETNTVGLSVSMNNTILSPTRREGAICLPQLHVEMLGINEENQTFNLSLESAEGKFYLPPNAFVPGNYSLLANSYVSVKTTNGSCSFIGDKSLGRITIHDDSLCQEENCTQLKETLQDEYIAKEGTVLLPNTQDMNFALLLDTSESMTYQSRKKDIMHTLVKLSAQSTLITFNEQSHLEEPLTADDEEIYETLLGLSYEGTTLLSPALEKASVLRNIHSVIIVTDGKLYDTHKKIYSEAEKLIQKGICINVLALGINTLEDEEIKTLFNKLVAQSQQKNSCGKLYHNPGYKNLITLMYDNTKIQQSDEDLTVVIEDEKNHLYFSQEQLLKASVTSTKTALILPQKNICTAIPELQVIIKKGSETVSEIIMERRSQQYSVALPTLLPGKYSLEYQASTACNLTGTRISELIILGEKDNPTLITILTPVLLVLFLLLLFLFWKKNG